MNEDLMEVPPDTSEPSQAAQATPPEAPTGEDPRLTILDRPTPGSSLTAPPDQKLPFERPPEITDLVDAKNYIWKQLSSSETIPQLFEMIRQDIPVADIAQTLTFTGFANGKWNYDTALLLIEPTLYMIMFLSKQAGLDFVYSDKNPSLEAMIHDDKNKIYRDKMMGKHKEGLMSRGT